MSSGLMDPTTLVLRMQKYENFFILQIFINKFNHLNNNTKLAYRSFVGSVDNKKNAALVAEIDN